MSSGIRTPRGRRVTITVVTTLVAVLVLAWGAAEAIYLAMHRRTFWFAAPDVARFGRQTRLSDVNVLIAAVAVFVLGLLLLGAALLPARRKNVELAESDPELAIAMTPGAFRHTLAAAAVEVDGVSEAQVKGRRRLRIVAGTPLNDADALPERVRARVVERLDALDQPAPRSIRVRLEKLDG